MAFALYNQSLSYVVTATNPLFLFLAPSSSSPPSIGGQFPDPAASAMDRGEESEKDWVHVLPVHTNSEKRRQNKIPQMPVKKLILFFLAPTRIQWLSVPNLRRPAQEQPHTRAPRGEKPSPQSAIRQMPKLVVGRLGTANAASAGLGYSKYNYTMSKSELYSDDNRGGMI